MKYKTYNVQPKQKLAKRKRTEMLILHCTATKEGKPFSCDDVDKMHKANGWSCIGYNWYIDLDGKIWEARGADAVGAHCSKYNYISCGICYCGGLDKNGKSKNTLTDEQKQSLFELVEYLLNKYNLTISDVYGHRTFAKKDCPCFTNEWFRTEYQIWKNNKYSNETRRNADSVPYVYFTKTK